MSVVFSSEKPVCLKRERRPKRIIPVLLLMSLFLGIAAACSTPQLPSPTTSTSLPVAVLIPYETPTATQTLPAPTQVPVILVTPIPSPTPLTYKIKEGDTMLGIAYAYGITLDELKAANPKVDPRAMSVGTVLVIPVKGGSPTPAPSATPVPLNLTGPDCYPTVDMGVWCVALVKNDQNVAYENLSAWMGVFSGDGSLVTEKQALPPLDLLLPGEVLPVIAEFKGPLPTTFNVQAQLETVLPVISVEGRYLQVSIQVENTEIEPQGRWAAITGRIVWAEDQPVPGSVWIVAMAFDSQERVVGVRKEEFNMPCGEIPMETNTPIALPTCTDMPFKIIVYSQGPAIARVLPLVEARP